MGKLLVYLAKRILLYVVIFILSLTVFFFILHLGPEDPVSRYVAMMQSRYGYASEVNAQGVADFKKNFGLDKPLPRRYLAFMGQLFLHGNFGPSMVAYPAPAQSIVFKALPWTVGLLGISVVISWVLGMAVGTVMGWRRGTRLDASATPIALVLSQVPIYLMALLLATVFVYAVVVFPSGGPYAATVQKAFTLQFIGSVIYHGLLPAISMVLVSVAGWSLGQRALVINLLGEDYMRLAEAKGLPARTLANRYVLRNTLLPQSTALALSLGGVVNGFFLIEWIFRYPGIGRLFVSSITALDYNVLLSITVIAMFVVLLANLLMEFVYPLIDPRIRRG
jgi:peptide/nickel transport system permease protein